MDVLTHCLAALKHCHQNPSDRTIWHAESALKLYVARAGDTLEARSQAVDALEGAWRIIDPARSSTLVEDFIEKWRRKLASSVPTPDLDKRYLATAELPSAANAELIVRIPRSTT